MSTEAGAATAPRLALRKVGKRFGQTWVLRNVSLEVRPGSVHAVAGLNGSGKSTLMRAVYGAHQPDEGQILLDGTVRRFRSPRDALALGVAAVPQELPVVPGLTVTENIYLGMLPADGGVVHWRRAADEARRVMAHLHADIDVTAPVAALDLAAQQLVTVARALVRHAGVIVFDEPTSALPARSAARLREVIRTLRADGEAVLFISQRLGEVLDLADEVTVLRDGLVAAQGPARGFTQETLIHWMVHGRDTEPLPAGSAPQVSYHPGQAAGGLHDNRAGALLSIRNLTTSRLRKVSLDVEPGEIVGLLGLPGAGGGEILRAVFGAIPDARGTVRLDGAELSGGVGRRISHGLAYVTGDRSSVLVGSLSVAANMALPGARRLGLPLRTARDRRATAAQIAALNIQPPLTDIPVSALSGGNQQKVVLARWLPGRPRVWLFDDPTRGVDAQAQADIHSIIRDRVREGACGLLHSSDLRELQRVADRCLLIAGGRIVSQIDTRTLTAEEVGALLERTTLTEGTAL